MIITPEAYRLAPVDLITDARLIEYFIDHPDAMRDLGPRQFEELVADLLGRFGYAVHLGPKGKDGGVDVYAERRVEVGSELVLVQCKRHAEDRKVTQPVMKQLHADVRDREATRGLAVTTSTFTADALEYIEHHRYRLAGADFDRLKEWLQAVREHVSAGGIYPVAGGR